MLIELNCKHFANGKIVFHPGLNVVLGDSNATNSIGKSSLLMLVDFAFGGSTFIQHNADVVSTLDHFSIDFAFRFSEKILYFSRETSNPGRVWYCDSGYRRSETIELGEYCRLLFDGYGLTPLNASFREIMGTFSRVWGMDNLNPQKPLHTVQKESDRECVSKLLRMMGRDRSFFQELEQRKKLSERQKVLRSAKRNNFLPGINKTQYNLNRSFIEKSRDELEEIRQELKRFATSISEITNREIIEIKEEKDKLLERRLWLQNRLKRIEANLKGQRGVNRKAFEPLLEFFDNINVERLEEVERFHSSISIILRDRLRESASEFALELGVISEAISRIDSSLKEALGPIDAPSKLIERVMTLSSRLSKAELENQYYQEDHDLKGHLEGLESKLGSLVDAALSDIENSINTAIRELSLRVFGSGRKSPRLSLSQSKYSFDVFDDTGTGVKYTSLIEFDLAVFSISDLPSLIHDSVLFKNIENSSVAVLLQAYSDERRQSFIALDEIEKYGDLAADLLREMAVIELSSQNVLFGRSWGSKK